VFARAWVSTEYGQRDRVIDRGHGIGSTTSVIALMRQSYALDEHRAAILVLIGHGQWWRRRQVQRLVIFQPLDFQRSVALGYETLPSDPTTFVVTVSYRERMDVRWFCNIFVTWVTTRDDVCVLLWPYVCVCVFVWLYISVICDLRRQSTSRSSNRHLVKKRIRMKLLIPEV